MEVDKLALRSPRIFCAERASNTALFLVLGTAYREFIVDIGKDRDGGVDPSRQAAAELQPGDLTRQRHEVRAGKGGVLLSPPIPPEVAIEIRLPHLTAPSHNRPFGPEPDPAARPRGVAEGDIAKPVIVVPEGHLLP